MMIKRDKILEYIIYLLAFFLPWQTRWIIKPGVMNGGYWEYGTISLYIFDLILMAGIILYVWHKNNSINKNKPWPFILFGSIILINVFWSDNKELAIFYFVRIILALGFYVLLSRTKFNKLYLIYSFLAAALGQAIFGIWQFLAQTTFASKYLGVALHEAGVLGTSVVETANGERWLRAYGGLDHPNMFGGFMALAAILAINLVLRENTRKYEKIIFLTAYIFYLNALFFSFSRVAWAGLAVYLLVLFIYILIKKKFVLQKKMLYIILFTGIFMFILGNIYSSLLLPRISNNTRLEIISSQERLNDYARSINIIKDNWLLGVGAGNYGVELNNRVSGQPAFFYQPAHNTWLLILIETGLIGLISFTSIFYIKIKPADWHNKLVLIVIMLMMLGDHWWWSLHFGVFFVFFIMYVAKINNIINK